MIRRYATSLLLGVLLLVVPGAAYAQVVWTGDGDGTSWSDASNWSPQTVPGTGDEVEITKSPDSSYTVQLSSSRQVARLRIDSREATLQLGAALTVSGAYAHDFGTLAGSGDLTVGGKITWDNGTMVGSGTTVANGGIDIQGGTLEERRLVVPAGQTAIRPDDTFAGKNGAVIEIESGAVLEYRTFRDAYVASGSSSPPTIVNRGTFKKTADSRTDVAWALENSGKVIVEEGKHLRFTGSITDAGGTYRAANGRLDLWPAAGVTFNESATLAADSGATLNLSHSADADTAPQMTIAGTYDVEGTTAMGETHPAAEVTIAASADVQDLGREAFIMGDRGRFTVEATDPLTVGHLDISFQSHLVVNSDLTVEGPMVMDNTSARFESAHLLTVEGTFTWSGGTMVGSGTTVAEGGLTIDPGAGSASRNTRLSERRLVLPSGATGTYPGNGALEGGNGAILEVKPGAVFDIQKWGDFTVFSGSSAPPKVVNRGTFKKTAGGSETEVNWALENHGTVASSDDLLRFRGTVTDEGGTYRATGARLSLRPPLGQVTFGSGSGIEADSSGTINFGRRSRAEPEDTSVVFTVEGTYDVKGTTAIRGARPPAEVLIAASADLQDLGGKALVLGGSDGHLTVETTEPLTVGRLTMDRKGRLEVRSKLTVEGPMLMDHTTARFENGDDLVVKGTFTWNGGRMTGSGTTIADGGFALDAGYGSASHNNYLDGRRLVLPSGTRGTYPGAILEGGNGATIEIESGADFTVQETGDFDVFSGSSALPKIVNRGTITKTEGSRMRIRWPFENHGTVTVDDGDVQLEGPLIDAGGTYRAMGNSQLSVRTDSSVTFGPGSTLQVTSGAQFIYESGQALVSRGVIEASGDVDLRPDSGGVIGPGSTLQVGPDAQLTYESNEPLLSRGAFELDGFLVAHQRASRNDPTALRLLSGGELRGAGTVTIGRVANDSGLVRPGGDGAAGLLNIQGDYRQGDSAALELELGGTTSGETYDRLDAENVQLAGTLRLALLGEFAPGEGDLLQPLQWSGERSGTFGEVAGQQAGDALLAVEYGSEALRVYDGSLPEPPDPPSITVEMQAPPFARVGRGASMTARAVNNSDQVVFHTVDKLGGEEIDESLFDEDCPQSDNYENLKCRMERFGVTPPPPPEGESYPRLATEPLFSSGGGASSSATRAASKEALTTTRMAFFNGSGPVTKEISKSCENADDKKTAEIELGSEQINDADLERCALEAASLVLSVVPGADCFKLGAGVTLNVAKGFYTGSFDLPAYIASQTLQASKCAGDFAGFGTAVKIIDKLNGLKGKGGAIKNTVDSCVPDPSKVAARSDQASTTCLAAIDPNDKKGPPGVGPARYTTMQDSLPYTVFFENKPEASAPAQQVVVSDTLEPSRYDLESFSFGLVAFGDTSVAVPEDTAAFSEDVDLRPERDLILRIEGELSRQTGVLSWTFTSLDPETMEPTEDPTAGFLPPNDDPPEGEGSVSYFADLKDSLASGDSFGAAARIVFDENDPIDTPVWSNALDLAAPASQVKELAETQDSAHFEVQWSGSDAESGIEGYDIYVSKGDEEYSAWLEDTTATSATYEGERGAKYAFYSVARDSLGHEEEAPPSADATTRVRSGTPAEDAPGVPAEYALQENHPNPFSQRTTLRYALPEAARVRLVVYDMLGRRVATLVDRRQAAGRHEATVEASELPSGTYVYRLRAGDFAQTRRMVVVK